MKNTLNDVVILIPSYEPDSLFIKTITELHKEGYSILVVNDGSSEEYDKIFSKVKEMVSYIKQEPNKGKGAALKLGFSNILKFYPDAKYVITADGDGQHSLTDINKVYEKLKETDQLVFGVRTFKGVPFRSKFGNDLSKITRSLLTKQYIGDDQCGLRGFPIRYIDELVSIKGNRYEYEMNQIVLFQIKHYEIVPLPIETIYLEENSSSHFSPVRDTIRIQSRILSHSIVALLGNILLILGIYFGIKNSINSVLTVSVSYLITTAFYLAVISLVYPSKKPFKRLLKECTYMLMRMLLTWVIIYSFVINLNLPIEVFAPVAVIFSSSMNVLISYLVRRKK